MIDFGKWEKMIDVVELHKKSWAKTLIKFVADIDRKNGNNYARNNLKDMTKFPHLWAKGAKKHKKENLIMFAYFNDARHRFIDLFSSLLRKQLHDNHDQGMYFDEYAEYHDWWWFWENLENTIFPGIFMKKLMEHIDETIRNPKYLELM